LRTKRALLEKLEKSYSELEDSKLKALEELINKKDEELKAAHRGWLKESMDKVWNNRNHGIGSGSSDSSRSKGGGLA